MQKCPYGQILNLTEQCIIMLNDEKMQLFLNTLEKSWIKRNILFFRAKFQNEKKKSIVFTKMFF